MTWVDAQAMHRRFPTTFDSPSENALRALRAGAVVKISDSDERFWVEITKITTARDVSPYDVEYEGKTVNELLRAVPYAAFGSVVRFQGKNVYLVWERP